MQIQGSASNASYYPQTQQQSQAKNVSAAGNQYIQINIGQGLNPCRTGAQRPDVGNLGNSKPPVDATSGDSFPADSLTGANGPCVKEPIISKPSESTPTSGETNYESLFSQLKNTMTSFMTEMKEMIKQSLSDITDMVKAIATSILKPSVGTGPTLLTPETTNSGNGDMTKPSTGSQSGTPTADKPVNLPNALGWNDKALEFLRPGSSGRVTEGELQEALVSFQVYEKGTEAVTAFRQAMEAAKETSSAVQGNIKASLLKVVTAGFLTKEEAEKIYSISHRAAQLDESTGAISNSKSEGALLSDAIKAGGENLQKIRNGEIEYSSRTIS